MTRVYVAFDADIDGFYDATEEEKIEAIKVVLESGAEATNIDVTIQDIRFEDEEDIGD